MKRKLNFWYGSIFGTYWMIYSVIGSFTSVFLLANGYSNSQIGLTMAAGNILAVILQPVIADLADRSAKAGALGIADLMTVLMMIFTIGMFIFKGGGAALCVVMVLLIGWHTSLQPLFNSLTFKLEESGIPVNFGIARSVGSLAYSALVAVLGTLVEQLGIVVLPVSAETVTLMLLISLLMTGRTFRQAMRERGERERERALKESDDGESSAGDSAAGENSSDAKAAPAGKKEAAGEDSGEEKISMLDFVRRNRLFFVLNIGVIGLFFSNSILNTFMIQIVEGVGGTSEDMGRILGLMAFLEIPTMVFFSRLKQKFSCETLLKAASVGFTVKIALCWLADSVPMLFFAQLFQLVSFALFLPGMVYFTGENMSRGEAVRGQALFTTMITVTTIFSSIAGGWILDISSPKVLTFTATLATAAGAVLVIAVAGRIRKKSGKEKQE